MNDKQIKEAIDQINVPKAKVTQAIQKGLGQAVAEQAVVEQIKVNSVKFLLKPTVMVAAITLIFFGAGFFFPSLGRAFADIPLIGSLYARFHDPIGQGIGNNHDKPLVIQENKAVKIQVMDAYYDAGQVGIVYQLESLGQEGQKDPDFPNIFIGGKEMSHNAEFDLEKNEGNKALYDGFFRIHLDYLELPSELIVTLKFPTSDGELIVDVPIKQLATKITTLETQTETQTEEGLFQARIVKIVEGTRALTVDYQIEQPKGLSSESGWIDFYQKNKQGEEILLNKGMSGLLLEARQTETRDITTFRSVIPNKEINLEEPLIVKMSTVNQGKAQLNVSLTDSYPKEVKSSKEKYTFLVQAIEEDQSQVTVKLDFPFLEASYNQEELANSLSNFAIGTEEYIANGDDVAPQFFEDPTQFYIKYGQVTALAFNQKLGWQATITYDKKETHGWGDYFNQATFDSKRAYFGGKLGSSKLAFDPIAIDLPK